VIRAFGAHCHVWTSGNRGRVLIIRVYLQRSGYSKAEYLGEIDLDVRPFQGGRISFTRKGKHEAGHIESVAPPNWKQTGVIPMVRVVHR